MTKRRGHRARVRYNRSRRSMIWKASRVANRQGWREAFPHYLEVAEFVNREWGHERRRSCRVAPRGGLLFVDIKTAFELLMRDYGDNGPPIPLL